MFNNCMYFDDRTVRTLRWGLGKIFPLMVSENTPLNRVSRDSGADIVLDAVEDPDETDIARREQDCERVTGIVAIRKFLTIGFGDVM